MLLQASNTNPLRFTNGATRNAAPGKKTKVSGRVKNAIVCVITNGPTMFAMLANEATQPCNSPCALGGTLLDIRPLSAGSAMVCNEPATMTANSTLASDT